ncbi:MAG: FHA domain-containing protein [Myxococcaceae bacterium]|nr:MAG: FHA domain-containing protein [Myxococcaceae bacterium]
MIRITYTPSHRNAIKHSECISTFPRKVVVVGRSSTCDLALADEEASGHHCELRVLEGALFIIDSGSTNGTYVNGKK